MKPEEIGLAVLARLQAQVAQKRLQGEKTRAAVRALVELDSSLSAREVRARLAFPLSLRRVREILRELRAAPSVSP